MRAFSCLLLVVGFVACKDASPQGSPRGSGHGSGQGSSAGSGAHTAPRDAQGADANLSVADGAAIYAELCAPCHGKKLEGYAADNAPSLNNKTFLESATDDFLTRSIITGRPGTSMAAYGKNLGGPLDDAAVKRLVGFLREHGPAATTLALAGKGDPALGEPLYTKNCATCHGNRTARGEAIHLANMMFQAQAQDPFIKHAIVNGRPGTKMIAFTSVLSNQEIDHVVAFVRSLGSKEEPKISQLPAPTGKEPLVLNPKGKEPTWKLRDNRFAAVDDVAKSYKAGQKMIIIDARPPSEWMRAHIKGAVSIPYFEMGRLDEVPKNTWVVTYCACPHHLSGIVADELVKRGYKKVVVLDEGINDWHRKGYPMTVAEGVEPPPAVAPVAPMTPAPSPH
jgi:mono/diheme cytochrome c family protein/rhodanese-related sulfurtransferase